MPIQQKKTKYECDKCKYFRYMTDNCEAFPKIIPIAIASGEISHRKSFKGDKGIQFEKSKDGKIKEHIFI